MYLNRLKVIDASRASRLTGMSRKSIYKAMDLYAKSKGKMGLAYIVEDKWRKIRLCAIDDWLSRKEKESVYARYL